MLSKKWLWFLLFLLMSSSMFATKNEDSVAGTYIYNKIENPWDLSQGTCDRGKPIRTTTVQLTLKSEGVASVKYFGDYAFLNTLETRNGTWELRQDTLWLSRYHTAVAYLLKDKNLIQLVQQQDGTFKGGEGEAYRWQQKIVFVKQ